MDIKLNLVSKPYMNRQAVRLWLVFACVFMAVLLLLNCIYGYQNYRQLHLLESRFQEMQGQVYGLPGAPAGYTPEKYAAIRSEIALGNEIVAADQFRWTFLLNRFEELLPDEVTIRNVQPDFNGHALQLDCLARDVSAMTKFVDNLLTSKDLNKVFLQRHAEVESGPGARGQAPVGFSLVIREAF